jgi:RNA polymerase sigma factor for flagellar operon FliA
MKSIGSVQHENGPKTPDWELVRRYDPLLKSIVHRMLPYFHGSYEEVYSTGLWGLINATQNFEFRSNRGFATYAKIRIYGALRDELRRNDGRFRRTRRILKLAPSKSFSPEVERKPVPTFVSLDTLVGGDGEHDGDEVLSDLTSPNGREILEHGESLRFLREEYVKLSPRPRKLFSLYYFAGFRFSEIASLWGITESRVCQLHARTVRFLKFKRAKAFFGEIRNRWATLFTRSCGDFSTLRHSPIPLLHLSRSHPLPG